MKTIKKIYKPGIALLMCLAVCASIYIKAPQPEISSVSRQPIYEGTLILDESVPLSDVSEMSVCIQALRLINEYRQSKGLSSLLWSKDLEAAAAIRADEARICWSHTRPNGQEWYTVNPSIMYGENLGKGYHTADELVTAWKNSPEHNENLLWADFSYAAISCVGNTYALEFA